MAVRINMVQGNTAPKPVFNLQRDGAAVNLTSATSVLFRIADPDTGVETNSGANAMTIAADKTLGQVTYSWGSADLPNAKSYQADVEIHWNDGTIETPFQQVLINARAKN